MKCVYVGACHYRDVLMSTMASQITSLEIVYLTVYSGADQRKHQSAVSLAFVRGINRWIPSQRASNAEWVSIWWRHHVLSSCKKTLIIFELISSICCEIAFMWMPCMKISQQWFKKCFGAARQTAITWAKSDPDLCRHMASPGQRKLNQHIYSQYLQKHLCRQLFFKCYKSL